jgi:hypothetical protein
MQGSQTRNGGEKLKTWERTKTPGLLRHKGGRYYGRFSIGGKTKFVPLNCTLMEIARVRFAEEKAKIERVRRAARANEQGVATLGQLLEIYRGRITNKTGIAESTRKRNLEIRARTIEPFPANEPTASVRFELPASLPR